MDNEVTCTVTPAPASSYNSSTKRTPLQSEQAPKTRGELTKPILLLQFIHRDKIRLAQQHRSSSSILSDQRALEPPLHLPSYQGDKRELPVLSSPAQPAGAPSPAHAVEKSRMAPNTLDTLLFPGTFFVPQVPSAIRAGAFQMPPAVRASSLKKTRRYFMECSSMVRLIKLVWHTGVVNTIPR